MLVLHVLTDGAYVDAYLNTTCNEPAMSLLHMVAHSHHRVYLSATSPSAEDVAESFTFIGQPFLAQAFVRYICAGAADDA